MHLKIETNLETCEGKDLDKYNFKRELEGRTGFPSVKIGKQRSLDKQVRYIFKGEQDLKGKPKYACFVSIFSCSTKILYFQNTFYYTFSNRVENLGLDNYNYFQSTWSEKCDNSVSVQKS